VSRCERSSCRGEGRTDGRAAGPGTERRRAAAEITAAGICGTDAGFYLKAVKILIDPQAEEARPYRR
jgi:hypothetical protein